jgi:hypothetical protein
MSDPRDVAPTPAQDNHDDAAVESLLTGQADDHDGVAPLRGLRPADIRRANRELILTLLARDGPASRVTLALQTGLSRVTVGAIVAELLREGCLREEGSVPPSRAGGRRSTLLRLNESLIPITQEPSRPCWTEDSPHE